MLNQRTVYQMAFCVGTLACFTGISLFTNSNPRFTSSFADTHPSSGEGTGGTLIIGMSARNVPVPETPPTEGGEGYRFVGNSIFDALTRWDLDQGEETPTIIPSLAESWEVKEDQVTWVFNLREGVEFHDGTPFNAEAVEFAYDRILDPEFEYFDATLSSRISAQTQEIASYRAVDEYTFEITTPEPYSFLLTDIVQIYIPSPTAVQDHGNQEFRNNAIGTGPFIMDSYVDGEYMELIANEDYWGGRPNLDRLVLRPFGDPSTRLSALLSGDIDWAEVPSPDSLDLLRSQGFNISLKQYPHTIVLPLNVTRPPFDDVRVRQALQYAIDRESMCDSLLNGVCIPAQQFLFEGHTWNDPTFEGYSYDPDKSRELLEEAGYGDGLAITIGYPTGGSGNMYPGPMMELMQANFRDVGIEMNIVPMEWNNVITLGRTSLTSSDGDGLDGYYVSWGMDLPSRLSRFNSDRIPPDGCCNSMNYSNPLVDEAYQNAMLSFDDEVMNQYLREGMGIMANDSPVVFVVHDLNLRVLAPNVQGFTHPSHWYLDLTSIWMED
jgi:peptide/nickel transport system substrate-binding protein